MAYSLIAHALKQSTDTNVAQTADQDTTGANLLIIGISYIRPVVTPTISDAKSNSYTALTESTFVSPPLVRLFYNQGGTVGSGHWFKVDDTSGFPSIFAWAFSGSASSPLDSGSDNANSLAVPGTSIQPKSSGTFTPSEDNCLFVTMAGVADIYGTPYSIDSPFSPPSDQAGQVDAQAYGIAAAYEIQTTATARNPTWSWTGSHYGAASMAVFKAAAVAGTTKHFLPLLGAGG